MLWKRAPEIRSIDESFSLRVRLYCLELKKIAAIFSHLTTHDIYYAAHGDVGHIPCLQWRLSEDIQLLFLNREREPPTF